jgi:hypothetical protein
MKMKKKVIKAELTEIRQRLSHIERLAAIKWYFELPKEHKSKIIPDPNMRLFEDHSIHIPRPKNHIIYPDEELIKSELPKAWEDLGNIKGYWIKEGQIHFEKFLPTTNKDRDVFASQKEAESALAMAQLSQLMKVYRGKWVPVKGKSRFAIMPNFDDELCIYASVTRTSPISFETEKIATQFLNNFRPLINQYFMID